MDNLTIFLAKYLIVVPVLVLAYLFWKLDKKNRKQLAIVLVAGGILTIVLGQIISHLYTNPRPPYKDGITPLFKPSDYNGFPSDHTLAAAFLAFMAWGYSKKIGGALLIVAAIVGWARVNAGVHHLVDVVGSFVIAAAGWMITDFAVRRYLAEKANAKD